MFLRLNQQGINQIIIEGKRAQSNNISGAAIDDIRVLHCSIFGEYYNLHIILFHNNNSIQLYKIIILDHSPPVHIKHIWISGFSQMSNVPIKTFLEAKL